MQNDLLILIIEDEPGISHFMNAILSASNYKTLEVQTGKEGLSMAASHAPDLILLDLGLPDMDGLALLKTLRSWSDIPVIVVSARLHEREKVEALDLGADDYITKPFGTSELLARIRTALRHSLRTKSSTEAPIIEIGDLKIDNDKRRVTVADEIVHLTPIEYKILELLGRHAGKVLTHDFLIREIWGPYANENQTLRVNLSNIRRKIEQNPAEPRYIQTEIGVGYRMVEE
ncbi:DNA-binding response regulator KdpE [Listeria fleischmannii 1991]|uniref:KDP operon transcriptional regulatory protein KdpE n=2 Tax=Listeria fleischmannii TaxID=1069827 RepID=A0A2X3H8W8_9LIST|nr:response regulator transcription factor [Listeria fleischmannii]EMG28767.1 DNA-binding response regulator KdpE [Listeria fleischmannii subsp. fleischmannii LU2006-1]KMT60158.1 DNA-binding response regulator KdpE [Listeria fleischmannii 1991]SQC68831.1 KDP operon transcriptional regulatory protein KdpE [Listeria fleischmannii subsp. fleischmannii]